MTVSSANLTRLLDNRLREVTEAKYNAPRKMRYELMKTINSESAFEEFYDMGSVSDPIEFNGKVTYVDIAPQFHTKVEHKEYALGVQYERKLIDDKKYAVLDDKAGQLAEAADRLCEKLAVRPFGYAFSSAFDFMTSEEGVALCSSSHTNKSGTSTSSGFDNAGTYALSKTNVALTRIAMKQFRDNNSQRIDVGNELALIVPEEQADEAWEIVGQTPVGGGSSALDPENANNTINSEYKRYRVITYPRLSDIDTNNWFMVWEPQMKKDLMWFDRIKPEFKNTIDFDTYTFKTATYFRCSYGFRDWRWIYGNQVS